MAAGHKQEYYYTRLVGLRPLWLEQKSLKLKVREWSLYI